MVRDINRELPLLDEKLSIIKGKNKINEFRKTRKKERKAEPKKSSKKKSLKK